MLYNVLLRFRLHVIALTYGIRKAFLQINVTKNDHGYLKFPWFDNIVSDQTKIVHIRFARVVFGTTVHCSVCMEQLETMFKVAILIKKLLEEVLSTIFVDDFIESKKSVAKAFEQFRKLHIRFVEGNFSLRKLNFRV